LGRLPDCLRIDRYLGCIVRARRQFGCAIAEGRLAAVTLRERRAHEAVPV
jgi:hypothetical protein